MGFVDAQQPLDLFERGVEELVVGDGEQLPVLVFQIPPGGFSR
jgi:hypothetical protein